MANNESRQLVVDVVARIDKLEKGMARAKKAANDNYSAVERRTGTFVTKVNNQLASVGKNFAAGFLGGFAAGGIAGIVSRLGDVAKGVAEIGDQARRAGVSLKSFQEWKYVAQQNRIGIDVMTDGLKELNLRADEFVQTGKGSAAEAFQRLGYGAADLSKKLQDPSALLLEIIDRLGKFDKAAQIRIADELFGGSAGERFVELISQGEDGIKRTIDEAHNLGAVLDDNVIASAAELDRKFNAVATTVGSALKGAIVSAAESLTDFINAFNGFDAERTGKLEEHLADLGKERLDIERQIIELRDKQRNGEGVGDGIFGTSLGESTYLEAMADYQRRLEAISAEEERINKVIADRRVAAPPASTWTPPTPPPGGFGGTDKEAQAAERHAKAIRDLLGELQEELRLVGATNTEKEISAALRRVNVDATSAEGQQIASLITQINAETEARDKAKAAAEAQHEAVGNLFGMAEDSIMSLVDGTTKFEDAIKKLAVQLALAVAQAALLGDGPLKGLFGNSGAIVGGIYGVKA